MKFYKLEMRDEATAKSSADWFTTRKQVEHAERDFERRAGWPKTKIRELNVRMTRREVLMLLKEHAK